MRKFAKTLVFLLCLSFFSLAGGEEVKMLRKELKIELLPPLPAFDNPILVGIEKAHPDGYNSPWEAWAALRLYAQQGDAFWIMAICHHRNISKDMRYPWTIIPLAKQTKDGKIECGLENMLRIAQKTEVRFTMVRPFVDANYNGVDMSVFKRHVLMGKIPAPICPPDLGDIMYLMQNYILEEFTPEKRQAMQQMQLAHSVTPAGLFTMSVRKDGSLYKKFNKKKFANKEKALASLGKFPSSQSALVAKVRFSSTMLSHGYSDAALARLAKGNDKTVSKEFQEKRKHLGEYIALLEKNGVELRFTPWEDQEKFWK